MKRRVALRIIGSVCLSGCATSPDINGVNNNISTTCSGLRDSETHNDLVDCAIEYPSPAEKSDVQKVVEDEMQGVFYSTTEAAALRIDEDYGRWNPIRIIEERPLRVGFMQPGHEMNSVVVDAGREWEKYMGLRFDFKAKEDFDILVTQDSDRNSSRPGTASRYFAQRGEPTLHLMKFSNEHTFEQKYGIALHELGHALGLVHEHQNPRSNLQFNEDEVIKYYCVQAGWDPDRTRFNVLREYDRKLVNVRTDFDEKSVMMYTLPPELLADNETGFSRNYKLSTRDKDLIGIIYPEVSKRRN